MSRAPILETFENACGHARTGVKYVAANFSAYHMVQSGLHQPAMDMQHSSAGWKQPLRHLFDTAVAAAHPRHTLPRFLPPPPAPLGRVLLLAGGKAAGSMVASAEAFYRERHGLDAQRLVGLGVARHGYEASTEIVPVVGAGHPVPDEAGLMATRRILALADGAAAQDLAVVLISGGGSANWIAPAGTLTLAEKRALTQALLRSGATIGEINAVRKHLSRIKGGRLAARLAPAMVVTLAISDVPGDDPSTIASGPTVADATTLADARAVLARYGITPGEEIARLLNDPASETPKPGSASFQNQRFEIITRPSDALAAGEAAAHALGYEVISLGADLSGEARDVAAAHAHLALNMKAKGKRAAILSGGEFTVTMRGGGGIKGRGGPSQEYALALAISLGSAPGITAIAGDTDGTDGGRAL
jgi:glycerate 2-kinase